MKKLKIKTSLNIKICFLIIILTILMAGTSITVSYNIHKKIVDDYYKALVTQICRSEAAMINTEIVSEFLAVVQSDEYQQMFEEAVKNGDKQLIVEYLKSRDMYDDYTEIISHLDGLRANMDVKYIYVISLHGHYYISLFDPAGDVLELGSRFKTVDELSEYTTNESIPATVSNSEYGWLCSGYESIIDSNGEKIAVVGVDIDMNEIVEKRRVFLVNLIIYIILYVLAAAVLSMYFMQKMVVKPLGMLAGATKEFINCRNYSISNVVSLPLHTGDEVEELYSSIKKLESDIIEYIDNLTKITTEKERISSELNVATQIQANMLPRIFPVFPDKKEFDIYASMTPAKEVGGDFYDFFLINDDHLAVVIADVSGKGVPAALFMVIAKTLIKNRAQMTDMDNSIYSPAEILRYVNNQLCENNDAELFVTVWLGILEISTGKVMAANAGHECPAIRRSGKKYELIETKHSPVVAAIKDMRFEEHEFFLKPGDSLYIYTDGVAEATDSNDELFGTDRMLTALNADPDAAPKEILYAVKYRIDDFVGEAPQFDDITMLCLKYLGKGEQNNA